MALPIAQVKPGMVLLIKGRLYSVLASAHLKLGRGRGIQQVRLKSIPDGAVVTEKLRGNDKVDEVVIGSVAGQFLWKDNSTAHFMGNDFEQFAVPLKILGTKQAYLKEGNEYVVKTFDNQPIDLVLPVKMAFKVSATEPGLRGDRVSAGTKPATLQTGAIVQVPLHIKVGEEIVIDTRDGSYLERAKS